MYWKPTPRVKLYEALGAVVDGRIKIDGNTAKVYSSSGNKFYDITYDPAEQAIMLNDNASYYKGYLGYPGIAFLMAKGVLPYPANAAEVLKGVAWKDINVRFKNNFEKALEFVLSQKPTEDVAELEREVDLIEQQLKQMKFKLLGEKVAPPAGY